MKHETIDKEFFYLASEDKKLKAAVKEIILTTLKENGGRITFVPEDGDADYPVTATLWGKHDCPLIDIADVYLSGKGEIFADGYNQSTGILETEFLIYPEQFLEIMYFISAVLKWKDTVEEEKQEEQVKKPFEVTILFGSEVICEYKENGKFPSEEWLEENGGVINIKTFETEEQMIFYLEGLNDADGWLECLVLDDFMKKLIEEERKF
jgi:hypothetical protein